MRKFFFQKKNFFLPPFWRQMNNFQKKISFEIFFFRKLSFWGSRFFSFCWVFTAFFRCFHNQSLPADSGSFLWWFWTNFCTILTYPQESARKSAENEPLSRQNPGLRGTLKVTKSVWFDWNNINKHKKRLNQVNPWIWNFRIGTMICTNNFYGKRNISLFQFAFVNKGLFHHIVYAPKVNPKNQSH